MSGKKQSSVKSCGVGKAPTSSSSAGKSGKTMVAPGTGGGVRISRDTFERSPSGYFRDLHGKTQSSEKSYGVGKAPTSSSSAGVGKAPTSFSSTGNSGKTMVAPGTGGGVRISRDTFEQNPSGYFRDLHGKK